MSGELDVEIFGTKAMVKRDKGTEMTDLADIHTPARNLKVFALGLVELDKKLQSMLPDEDLPENVKHSAITYSMEFSIGRELIEEVREELKMWIDTLENPRIHPESPGIIPKRSRVATGLAHVAGAASGVAVAVASIKPDNWSDGNDAPDLKVFDKRETADGLPAVPVG